MRKLRIGIIDLAAKGPTKALWARVMNANLSSIMPQVIGVWCQRAGHDVTSMCYTGFEDLSKELPQELDVLFIGAFTESALLAYAISSQFRAKGVVTVLLDRMHAAIHRTRRSTSTMCSGSPTKPLSWTCCGIAAGMHHLAFA